MNKAFVDLDCVKVIGVVAVWSGISLSTVDLCFKIAASGITIVYVLLKIRKLRKEK